MKGETRARGGDKGYFWMIAREEVKEREEAKMSER